MSTETIIDHEDELVMSLIATQYRESPNLTGYIKALLDGHNELELLMHELALFLNLEAALKESLLNGWEYSYRLDIIGKIVGQNRIISGAGVGVWFAYQDNDTGAVPPNEATDGYGDLAIQPLVGGTYWNRNYAREGSVLLVDRDYARYILARILANHTDGTANSIAEILLTIFPYLRIENGGQGVFVEDPNDIAPTDVDVVQEARITFYDVVPPDDQTFIRTANLIPKPLGVSYEFVFLT